MTGIQALARKYPTLPMKPGYVARVEVESIRHGTQTLIANLAVVTGQVIAPAIGPTRTQDDFVAHMAHTIAGRLSPIISISTNPKPGSNGWPTCVTFRRI